MSSLSFSLPLTSFLLLSLALTTACNRGGQTEEEAPVEDTFTGIYRITSYQVSEGNCDAPGRTLEGDAIPEPFLILHFEEDVPFSPDPGLSLAGCSDEADCQAKLAEWLGGGYGPAARLFLFFSRLTQTSADGETQGTGFWNPDTGICEHGSLETNTLSIDGDTITVSSTRLVADYTPEEPERCFTDEGGDAARENGTCETRVDLVAERVD